MCSRRGSRPRRSAADAFLAKVPKEYAIAIIGFGTRAFVALPATTDRVLAHDALASLDAERGHRDRRRGRPRRADRQAAARGGRVRSAYVGAPHLRRRARRRQERAARGGAKARAAAHIPVSTVLVGTASGVVTNKLVGGYKERIRVPAEPRHAPADREAERRPVLPGAHERRADGRLQEARDAHRPQDAEPRRSPISSRGGAIVLLLAGGALSAFWFRRLVP